MRANEFIIERKKKRTAKLSRYFFPGFAYYGSSGEGDSAGGDGGGESMHDKLPSLEKYDYDTIDRVVKDIAKRHRLSSKILKRVFNKKYKETPDKYIKGKLDETHVECDLQEEVTKFAKWASKKLNLKSEPKIVLSMDTEEAQTNHHTGGHINGDDKVWVYAKNRNLVDILRTVFHELVHVRQGELNMIKNGDSYPGSPIEAMADMLAGKYIKIYGEKNHHIFQ